MDGVGWGSSKGDGSSSGRLCLVRRSRDGMQPYTLMCVVGGGDGGGGGGGTSSDNLRHVFHLYTTILLDFLKTRCLRIHDWSVSRAAAPSVWSTTQVWRMPLVDQSCGTASRDTLQS